jgi:hypothetical protein
MHTTLRAAAMTLCLLSFGVRADDAVAVSLKVGETYDLCASGKVVCPVDSGICDDPAVATQREGQKGLQIVGVKAGATTCSARSINGLRQVFRVNVK